MNEKTIYFKIMAKENTDVYQEGYVEIPEDIEVEPDWFYYDQNGVAQSRAITHHDGIGLTQIGANHEQEVELDSFANALSEEVDFIDDVILNADEEEHLIYIRKGIIIEVNEGAGDAE